MESLESRSLLAVAPPADLVSWYRAEGDAGDSTGASHGVVVGGASYADGKVGQAFNFGGTGDYVEVPDAASLDVNPGGQFTVEFWFKRTSSSGHQHLMGKRGGCGSLGGDSFNWQIVAHGNDLTFGRHSVYAVAPGRFLMNQWTHMAATADGSMLRIYINGTLTATLAASLGPVNDAPLRIGTSGTCATLGQEYGGLIDELSLYDRALSQEEIQSIVSAGSEGKVPDLALRVTSTADSGPGSLRLALEAANADSDLDTITFAIPGTGPHRIRPTSPLPVIMHPIVIDGFSQPGAAMNTLVDGNNAVVLIELDGSQAGATSGLVVAGGGSTIRGLAIHRFAGDGIRLMSGNDIVAGNFIGTDAAGTLPLGNGGHGVAVVDASDDTLIYAHDFESAVGNEWSTTATSVTPIGARRFLGELGSQTARLTIPAAMIPPGTTELAVSYDLFIIRTWDGNHAGGGSGPDRFTASVAGGPVLLDTTFSNNVPNSGFAGQAFPGSIGAGQYPPMTGAAEIDSLGYDFGEPMDSVYNLDALFSYLGGDVAIDFTGGLTTPGPDESWGLDNVKVRAVAAGGGSGGGSAGGNVVGGTTPADRNRIVHNGGDGIRVVGDGAAAAILGNSIFGNAGLGIDLGGDGVTANGLADGDGDAGGLQNFPELASAVSIPSGTRLAGSLQGVPDSRVRLEFFASTSADATGHGEGERFLGWLNVTTNAAGLAEFAAEIPLAIPAGQWITATATDQTGKTSEFSKGVMVAEEIGADLEVTISDSPDLVLLGETITYSITVTNHGPRDASSVVVTAAAPETIGFPSVTVPWGTVPVGQSRSFHVNFTPTMVGMLEVAASVIGFESDPRTENNADLEGTQVAWPGKVVVVNTLDSGPGSLRQAILDTNAHPGPDVIEFDIPGPDYTISPLTPLPAVTDVVLIDGYSQPGSRPNTQEFGSDAIVLVEIEGSRASVSVPSLSVGLRIESNSVIRGLAINRFTRGLVLSSGAVVEGNYIGTDPTGTLPRGSWIGIEVRNDNNLIGGTTPAARNVISGNGIGASYPWSSGVLITGDRNTVSGNYIGTTVAGTEALPNHGQGVLVVGGNFNTIGGLVSEPGVAPGNLISGNRGAGLALLSESASHDAAYQTVIVGNLIGTDATGVYGLPNDQGVLLKGARQTLIGGSQAGSRNVISGNGWGVLVECLSCMNEDTTIEGNSIGADISGLVPLSNAIAGISDAYGGGLRILSNEMFSDSGLPIDLGPAGGTPNDPGDSDAFPQNLPMLVDAVSDGSQTTVRGILDSIPNEEFLIQFFRNSAATGGGNYLGSLIIATDANGLAAFEHSLPLAVSSETYVSTTATRLRPQGDGTSECSPPIAVTYPGQPVVEFSSATYEADEDGGVLKVTLLRSEGLNGEVSVDISTSDVTATAGEDYAPVTRTVVFGEEETSQTIEIAVTADAVFEGNETFKLLLSHPRGARLGGQGNAVATLLDPLSVIELGSPRFEVREGEKEVVITVTRSGAPSASASVDVTTVDGTASQRGILAGSSRLDDFTTTSGTLTFRPLQTTATIRVPIRDDSQLEGDETFQVVLSNPSQNARLGPIDSAEVIIRDNDPTISFTRSSSAREEIAGSVVLEVNLTPASSQTVAVYYSATGGSATYGEDYHLASSGGNVIYFSPGQTRRFIPVYLHADAAHEGDETAVIQLLSAVNAYLGTSDRHRVTIVDNDPPPPPTDPGSTFATALAIDLATLPRQVYAHTISRTDAETFRVTLGAGEMLALDVDPVNTGSTLPSSKIVIFNEQGQTVATVGASEEPETGRMTGNPATLFRADADGGTYYIQLSTTALGRSYGYSLSFHRIGVSSKVPSPDLLNVPGSMYASFDGDDTVGITGPTGYGFQLVGPWQQQVTLTPRSVLRSQTLSLAAGSQLTLRTPRGVAVPLIANQEITLSTRPQRWGDVVGEVSAEAISFPVSVGIRPFNDLLAEVFGSELITLGVLAGDWRISLGGRTRFNLAHNQTAPVDAMLSGVPYLRYYGMPGSLHFQVGGFTLGEVPTLAPVDWIVDPADPMLYVRVEKELGAIKKPGLGISKHGLLEYKPGNAPNPAIDAGVTAFYGHLYSESRIKVNLGKAPMEVDAETVINLDADRDGRLLGNSGHPAELYDLLAGSPDQHRQALNDIQLGANGALELVPTIKYVNVELFRLRLGRASVVLNGMEEAIWVRGEQTNPLAGTPLQDLSVATTGVVEGMLDFDGRFLLDVTGGIGIFGTHVTGQITITHEGITARLKGTIEWSVKFDYGPRQVSGKAIAEIEAELAMDIDDDGGVYLSGAVSASGRLRYSGADVFSGSIEASVRRKGFRFRFPRGVGNLDLDIC